MIELIAFTEWTETQFIVAIFVVFVASWVRGFSGFGFSALVMSGLTFVMQPSQVVTMALTLEVLASLHMAREVLKSMDFKLIGGLCIGAVLGTPVGVWALAFIPARDMRIILYVLILGLAILLLCSSRIRFQNTKNRIIGAGVFSGILNGMAAIGGLPIVLYLIITQFSAVSTRAILIGYLFLIDGAALAVLIFSGIAGVEVFWQCLILLPVLMIGIWFGSNRFQKTVPDNFKRFVLFLMVTISLLGLVSV